MQADVSARPWHWQAIISWREEDATALGLRPPPDWREIARRVMPQFGPHSGIAEADLRWVGAVHRKAGQPRVHLLAWLADAEPPRQPRLQRPGLWDIRRMIARELYGPLRAQLAAQRTAQRVPHAGAADTTWREKRGKVVNDGCYWRLVKSRSLTVWCSEPA